ncbi:MAG: glucosaminidase domain-containing protein [Bacteroidota bacterium]
MRNLFIVLLVGSICWLSSHPMPDVAARPNAVSEYLRKYQYLARELNQSTGIPVPIILAVAGLESNWGVSELAQNANNHFGIKTKPEWPGLTYCKVTLEYEGWLAYYTNDCFRQYKLIRDSYQDFGHFIKTRDNYQHLQNTPVWNYRAWADGLRSGGYATDPAYTDKLLGIIWRYKIYELVK